MPVCPACRQQYPPGAKFCPSDGQQLEEETGLVDDEDRFLGMLLDDRYRIEHRLGQGGMGVVYAARHVVIDKPVAIKILRHEYCRDKGLVQRFIREARAASRIGHPNIVDVTDFGRLQDGHIYFVMEYLVGITLARAVRDGGLSMLRVLDLGVQMCHGLAAAHAKGIVHRDLKPENIFIVNPCSQTVIEDVSGQRQDFVKLLDFGIAKFNFGQKTRITRLGSVFGTPQYMSPEQAAGEDADHRGDIYSMGCILYEMVTGEVPFSSDTFMGTLTKQMFETPTAPRELRPDRRIPGALESVILRMLAKDPGARFQSMLEVGKVVDDCMNDPQVHPGAAKLAPAKAERDGDEETFPPGETNLDLRGGAKSDGGPEDLAIPPANMAITPHPGEAPRRRHEPTDAVPKLPAPRSAASLGWVALAALLLIGLLITGMLIWRRSVAERRSAGAEVVQGAVDAGPDQGGEVVVSLNSLPQGAKVKVGGVVWGLTPLKRNLRIGQPLEVAFELHGHDTLAKTFVPSAADKILFVELQPQPEEKRRTPQIRRRRRSRSPGRDKPRGLSKKDLRNPFPRKKAP